MGKKSRTKGAVGEREVKTIINKKFDTQYERTPLSGGMDLKGDIRRTYYSKPCIVDDFHWEIKRVEKLNIHEAYVQALHDCRNKIPLVVHRRSNDLWKVTFSFEDFLNVIKELEELRKLTAVKGE